MISNLFLILSWVFNGFLGVLTLHSLWMSLGYSGFWPKAKPDPDCLLALVFFVALDLLFLRNIKAAVTVSSIYSAWTMVHCFPYTYLVDDMHRRHPWLIEDKKYPAALTWGTVILLTADLFIYFPVEFDELHTQTALIFFFIIFCISFVVIAVALNCRYRQHPMPKAIATCQMLSFCTLVLMRFVVL